MTLTVVYADFNGPFGQADPDDAEWYLCGTALDPVEVGERVMVWDTYGPDSTGMEATIVSIEDRENGRWHLLLDLAKTSAQYDAGPRDFFERLYASFGWGSPKPGWGQVDTPSVPGRIVDAEEA